MTHDGPTAPLLNAPQAAAVEHAQGPLLVFAGAGSGKTRVITYRVANLISTHHVPPYRILAVTFTNKAAGEMRERLDKLLGEGVGREVWVGTFHAICAKLLRRYPEAVGLTKDFVIYDDSDQRAVVTRALRELELDDKRFPPRAMLGRISREKNEGRSPADIGRHSYVDEIFGKVYQAYETHLHGANAVDFDDLLVLMARLAEDTSSLPGEELHRRFDYVLVDEFQDVNQVQYRLVRALSERTKNLCVVGDDDQSIYQWRGADVRNIRNFRHDFPDALVVKLEENYRSSSRIVHAALGVIRPSRERVAKELFTQNPAGDPVRIVTARDEHDEAAYVAAGLKQAIEAGIPPNDLAVFYRIHAMSRVIEEALRSENIPYKIVGGTRFFDRAEIKDLLSYLRVLTNPRSDVDLLRILNVPARGIGATTMDRLTDVATVNRVSVFDALEIAIHPSSELAAATKKKLAAFKKLLDDLRVGIGLATPSQLASRVLLETGYRKMLLQDDSVEAESRLQNLEELIGSMKEYEDDAREAGGELTLAGYLERVTLSTSADDGETETPRVSLMTVHSSKGLEFNSVFLVGMEEDLFPYRRPSEDDRRGQADEEERRLAYVAITRAREKLFIIHTSARALFGTTRYNRPSRFLGDIPAESVSQEVTYQAKYASDETRGRPRSAGPSARSGPWWDRDRASPSATSRPAPVRPTYQETRVVEREGYEAEGDEGFGVGSKVEHPKFGVGIVRGIFPGSDPSVTATFGGWGEKKVLVRFLKRIT
jgi:DNA helicase-2/ATP-dependent DNA helicase PcrA